jgi:dihydrolipoamide dehydrogenase
MRASYDLVVIGAGPGGYPAAIRARQMGAQVLLVERDEFGGTCLNRGCIPTKALLASAEMYDRVREASRFGVANVGTPTVDFKKVHERKDGIVRTLRGGLAGIFRSHGVDTVRGEASFTSPKTISIRAADGTISTVAAHSFIIATGSAPATVPGIVPDGRRILTSDHMLSMDTLPPSLLIVGGGVIGIEFASLFNRFGVQVTVVELMPRILMTEDGEIAERMRRVLEKAGVAIRVATKITSLSQSGDSVTAEMLSTDGRNERLIVSHVLVATGRRPNTEKLNLTAAGVLVERGAVVVNERMETNIPGIWAVGDVKGSWMLAYAASAEGLVAAENAFRGSRTTVDYRCIPSGIYTAPEIASVGLTEEAARKAGREVLVGRFPFAANGRAMILGSTEGFAKVVADRFTDEILGVHIIGPEATELISTASVAMGMEATLSEFQRMFFPHPSLSEAMLEAAEDCHHRAVDLPKS